MRAIPPPTLDLPPTRRGGFFFLLLLILGMTVPLAAANWLQSGADISNTRGAPVAALNPNIAQSSAACLGALTNRDIAGEQLIITETNVTSIIIPTIIPSSGASVFEMFRIAPQQNNSCSRRSYSLADITGNVSVTALGLVFFQPAILNTSVPQLVYPVYSLSGATQGNLSVVVANITNGTLVYDRMRVLNYTDSRAQGSAQIGESVAIKCVQPEICMVYSNDLPIVCGINTTTMEYACSGSAGSVNLTKGFYRGYIQADIEAGDGLDGISLSGLPSPSQFALLNNGSAVKAYALIQNVTGSSAGFGQWLMTGHTYFTNTNAMVFQTAFGSNGIITLEDASYPSDLPSFTYLSSSPSIISYPRGEMVSGADENMLFVAYSRACFSDSGACAGASDLINTTYNRVALINAYNGGVEINYTDARACNADPSNASLDAGRHYPRVGQSMIVTRNTPTSNETWACLPMQGGDAKNMSFDGEVFSCNREPSTNIAGVACYNLTPERYAASLFLPRPQTTPWPFGILNSSMYNASEDKAAVGSAGINNDQAYQFGPRYSPFGIVDHTFNSWTAASGTAWAAYSAFGGVQIDSLTLSQYTVSCLQFGSNCDALAALLPSQTVRANSTVHYSQARYYEPYGPATDESIGNWIGQNTIDTCVADPGSGDLGIGVPDQRPEIPADPFDINGLPLRFAPCDQYAATYTNISAVTVAATHDGFNTVWATVWPDPYQSSTVRLRAAWTNAPGTNLTAPQPPPGGLTLQSWHADTNITNTCENSTVNFTVTIGARTGNDAWQPVILCDAGTPPVYGNFTTDASASVRCTYNTSGTKAVRIWLTDLRSQEAQNWQNAAGLGVSVSASAGCQSSGQGGGAVQNASNNVMPNFNGGILHTALTQACFNQPLLFSVRDYYNPEASDIIYAGLNIHGVTLSSQQFIAGGIIARGLNLYLRARCEFSLFGGITNCPLAQINESAASATITKYFSVNGTIWGDPTPNGTAANVTWITDPKSFPYPGVWNVSLFITDNTHINNTAISIDYQVNVRPFDYLKTPEQCITNLVQDINEGVEEQGIRDQVRSALYGLGFKSEASVLIIFIVGAIIAALAVNQASWIPSNHAMTAHGLAQAGWLLLSLTTGLIPLYYIIVPVLLMLMGGAYSYLKKSDPGGG